MSIGINQENTQMQNVLNNDIVPRSRENLYLCIFDDILLTSMTLSIYSIYDYLSIFMCVTLTLEYNLMWKDMVWVRSSNFDDEFQYRFL